MKERELNFVNSLNNRVRKRYYCDDSGEINSVPVEENDQIYVINDDQLYQVELIDDEETFSEQNIINFSGRNNTKIEDLKININPVQAGSGDPHPAIYSTVSGDVISFNAPAAANLKNLKVSVDPVQDLHGYENPWPDGGGKNKLAEDYEIGGISSANGANVSQLNTLRSAGFSAVNAGESYYLSLPNVSAYLFWYSSNSAESFLSSSGGYVTRGVITVPTGAAYLRIQLNSSYGTTYNNDIAFNYPSSVTAYSPYSNICPISGWSAVNVWRTGSNVWDEEWESGQYNGNPSTGVIGTAQDSTRIRTVNDIPVMPLTTYYVHSPQPLFAYFLDENKTWLNRVGSNGTTLAKNATFTTPENCRFMKFFTINTQTYNHDISINYPATDTDYHAYSGNQYTIQLGQTVYGGTLDVTNGVLTVDRAMVDLGSLMWTLYGSGETAFFYSDSSIGIKPSTTNAISSMFQRASITTTNTVNNAFSITGNPYVRIRCLDYSDATAFKTAVTGQTLVYELATPITIPLTPQEISTLQGQNNLWADSGGIEAIYMSQSANIRPISGQSAVNVWNKPTYDPTANPTATIQLGQTVYGGTLDVTNGVLTVDRAMYVADGTTNVYSIVYHRNTGLYYTVVTPSLDSVNSNPISNRFKGTYGVVIGNTYITNYGSFLVAVLPDQTATSIESATQWFSDNPTQWVYELATPITIPLTPQEITTLLGTNNLWANTGKIKTLNVSTKGKNVFALAPPKT